MFSPGQIIYFNEFHFKNGNTPKAKYFIVLANVNEEILVASLPTRTNLAASLIDKPHGCVNIDDRCFNCYVLEKDRVVGKNGFSFPLPTYVYGDQVEDYQIELMQDIYKIKGIDYDILDTLTDAELTSLVNCIKNSSTVKRKIKKLL